AAGVCRRAQKRLDRIADRHNPLARHACALEIASHALVHENEMRWLIVDIEQALTQEMPHRAPCLLMEAALVALGEEAGCGHGNQIADGGPGEVDEAPVRTGEEIVMRMKHHPLADGTERAENGWRKDFRPAMHMIDGRGGVGSLDERPKGGIGRMVV